MATDDVFTKPACSCDKPAPDEDRITLASHRLAIEFTEDEQLPVWYRKGAGSSQKRRKGREDSNIEKRFKANVQAWRALIETMLTKCPHDQAWRFIDLAPRMDGNIRNLCDSSDFRDFIDYLSLRRDKDNCDDDELGGLAQLSVAFQREIERRIRDQEKAV